MSLYDKKMWLIEFSASAYICSLKHKGKKIKIVDIFNVI